VFSGWSLPLTVAAELLESGQLESHFRRVEVGKYFVGRFA